MREEVRRWYRMAKDDLGSAQVNFDNEQYYVCVFLCQQSVEKGLKALLIKNTGELIKTHDLVVLGKKVNLPEQLLDKCEKLNGTYIDTRYGDLGGKLPSEKFNRKISSEFLQTAREVFSWLGKSI